MKTSLEDYKTGELKLSIDDVKGVVVIASQSSRQFVEGMSRYRAALEYAKANKIPLEESKVIDLGFDGLTHESKGKEETEFQKKAFAVLVSSVVIDWPFKNDLVESLMESDQLRGQINLVSIDLQKEFLKVKKT